MKHFRKVLGIFFYIFLLMSSCTEEEELPGNIDSVAELNFFDKSYIIEAEVDEQLKYKHFHLKSLVEKLTENVPSFHSEFDTEQSKDGDYGVIFFEDLMNKNLTSKNSSETQFSLDAFLGVSEDNLRPYIRKIKEGKVDNPLYLIDTYNPESEKEVVIGFGLNSEGQLELIDNDVKREEVFGEENDKDTQIVYEIGIADDCGNYYKRAGKICDTDGTDGGGGYSGGGGGTPSSVTLALDRMRVKDLKESWVNGRAEVRLKAFRVENSQFNGCAEAVTASVPCSDNGGRDVTDLRRGDKGDLLNYNFVIDRNSYPYSGNSGKDIAFIVFEYDPWPAGRYVTYPYNGFGNYKIDYRSNNSIYLSFAQDEDKYYGAYSNLQLSSNSIDLYIDSN